MACATSAEAVIHVVPVNQAFNAPAGSFQLQYFTLAGAANFGMSHSRTSSGSGVARFGIFDAVTQAFNGLTFGNFVYVSKLAAGANIAALPFAAAAVGTLASGVGFANSQWKAPGQGYIGFKFNLGGGVQYGWVSVTANGTANANTFTLNSYAYGDVGDAVTAGQTVVPEPGSLALLAVGGAGLLAWRKRRAQTAKAALPA